MDKDLFNAKAVAEYLDINEKKVYALAKAKKIPCTKVTGKWLFPKKLIDQWILQTAQENLSGKTFKRLDRNIIFHGSNDVLIEVLAHQLKKQYADFSLALSNLGSLAGLISLKNGLCHLAGTHLYDPLSGAYNTPHIKKYLSDRAVVTIHLANRRLGLIVPPGNPRGIKGPADLTAPGITYINRQSASGTRVYLDSELRRLNIDPRDINGYYREAYTHLEVAMEVFNGYAQAGLGVYSAAHSLKLDFVPLTEERYDLVIAKENFFTPEIQAVLKIIRSTAFREKALSLGGYQLSEGGDIVHL